MPRHVDIEPVHETKREHAHEIVRKLEAHLGIHAKPTGTGHRFEFHDDHEGDLSEALDTVAPDWRNHVQMGL